eukprot:15472292-Alexandrium_andersonii.AAC.1
MQRSRYLEVLSLISFSQQWFGENSCSVVSDVSSLIRRVARAADDQGAPDAPSRTPKTAAQIGQASSGAL